MIPVRLRADRDRCCSAGLCVMTSAELFDQSEEDGRVVLRVAEVPPPLHEAARDAVRLCPSGALSREPPVETPDG